METADFKRLLDQYLTGALSAEGKAQFLALMDQPVYRAEIEAVLREAMMTDKYEMDLEPAQTERLILELTKKMPVRHIHFSANTLLRYAAVVILLFAAGAYFFFNTQKKTPVLSASVPASDTQQTILPGNKAILTLADGSAIILDSAANGELAQQNGVHIIKKEDGKMEYQAMAGRLPERTAPVFNTISTPRGGRYQLRLPDGSVVWLNAATSLKFPAAFTGKERIVELSGEAYFEIAQDRERPFKVKTPGQLVEVLGTSFNVNAYFDEPAEATTLLSGSVKVSGVNITGSGILKPGQQARTAATLSVLNVDTDLYTDWKDGYFRFSRENIQSIMRKISRWYDVDIRYEGQITREFFIGTMQRPDDLREVLDALKLTGLINYKIQGKNVTITP